MGARTKVIIGHCMAFGGAIGLFTTFVTIMIFVKHALPALGMFLTFCPTWGWIIFKGLDLIVLNSPDPHNR